MSDHDLLDFKINNWRLCYPSKLATHFQKNEGNTQFDRLSCLHLKQEDMQSLFHVGSGGTIDFNIMLGIDSIDTSAIDQFSFRPIISVMNASQELKKEFTHGYSVSAPAPGADEVPFIFLQWVNTNWMELDASLMYRAFTGSFAEHVSYGDPVSPVKRLTKRLLGYYFTKDINYKFWYLINKHRHSIKEVIFHLGVDMNKQNHHEAFTFSPVFEVQFDNLNKEDIFELHRLGLRSNSLGRREQVYYEYMAPCPSTCP